MKTSAAQSLLLGLAIIGTPCPTGAGLSANEPHVVRLNPDLSLDQYEYRDWSMQDGLPSDQVVDILQTSDGYLWVATENGLARFDGLKFTNFNRSNTPALVSNHITTLHEGRDAVLWIGTHRGGLIRCRPGHPPEFQRFEQLEGYAIHCLCEDRTGTLWIGTEVETWTLSDGKCEPSSDAPLNVMAMCKDDEGRLWLGASIWGDSMPEAPMSSEVRPQPGLFRFDNDRFYRLTAADGFPQTDKNSSVRALYSDGNGGIWIGTAGEGLLRNRDGKCEDHAGAGRQAKRYVDIHQDRSGHLWVATLAVGFHRLAGGRAAQVPVGRRPVRCIAEDRDGNIWFGGGLRGLRCISNPELIHVGLGVNGGAVRGLLEDSTGDLWFGSGGSLPTDRNRMGLHRLRDGTLENIGRDDGLPTHMVTGLALGPDGRLWIGTHDGLACRQLDGKLRTFTTADGLGRNWIRAVYVDRAGVVWVGLWEGTLQRMQQETFTTIAAFRDADVNWFHEDAGGVLWIGSNRGLYRWRSDHLERVNDSVLDELPTIGFSSCFEDDEGHLWLGTDGGGLCRYADGSFSNWTSEHGLYEDAIYAIQQDGRGHLWLGGAHGLTSLPRQSFNALEAGTIDRLEVRLHKAGGRFGPDYRPKVVRRKDGSLWFKTTAGVVVIPSGGSYHHPLPPLVHIEEVQVDRESIGMNTSLEVLSGARHIDFHYTANTFAAPERARFRYQLEGFDDSWIDAGVQRSASYTDLPPGRYVFRVTADNGHGIWSDVGAAIGFTVNPRWWETIWFRAVSCLAALGLGVMFFRLRTRRIRKANAALRQEIAERERAEAASRQHLEELGRVSRAASMGELTTSIAHEIKQPLFAIVSNAQTARRLLERQQPNVQVIQESLSDIASDGNRASDIIDHIHSLVQKEHRAKERIDLNAVASDVIKLMLPELHKRGLAIRTELADALPAVEGDPIELQQVILNLIINGAQAMSDGDCELRELLLKTSTNNGSVELAVRDCGVGLDETEGERIFDPFFTTKTHGTGMGLAINRTIIEAHGGRIWASSNADRGATFRFSLPICNNDGQS